MKKAFILLAITMALLWSCSEVDTKQSGQRSDSSGNDDKSTRDNDEGDTEDDANDDDDDDANDDDNDDNNDDDNDDAEDGQSIDENDKGNSGKDTEGNTADTEDTEGEICNRISLTLEAASARIMILQDLSSSMQEGIPTKWKQAQQALTNMLNTYNDSVDFGFDYFPNQAECAVDKPLVSDCLPDNKDNILSQIAAAQLTKSTPLYRAMQNFLDENYAPIFTSIGATRYLIIVSDGKDSCGLDNTMGGDSITAAQLGQLTAQLLTDMDIRTYVIGFGSNADPQQLNAIAAAGGTTVTTYFNAQNQIELEGVLNQIVGISLSCVFDIGEYDESEIDINKVNFYFDDAIVGMDDSCASDVGWTWVDNAKTKVQFCKESCDSIMNKETREVSATFGCPTQIVEVY